MELTSEQQCVIDWLRELRMTVFAEAYVGALELLKGKTPGYISLVAHVGRDFTNILAPTVRGIERPQAQYHQHLDKIQTKWSVEWAGRGLGSPEESSEGHVVPYETCELITELIDAHKAGRERSVQADSLFFSTFLDYDEIGKVPEYLLRDWKNARSWFVQVAHLRGVPLPDDAPTQVECHFKTLHDLLYVAASSEFERLRGLRDILEETNG